MKTAKNVCTVVMTVSVVLLVVSVALAVEVPALTPLDFPMDASPEAHWIWTAIAGEIVVALAALISQVVLGFIASIKNAKIAKAVRVIHDAVMVSYHEYVQVVKAASADGKLTIGEKKEALDWAYRNAIELARRDGFDLLKVLAKETVLALIERFVGEAKGKAVTLPLPDLAV